MTSLSLLAGKTVPQNSAFHYFVIILSHFKNLTNYLIQKLMHLQKYELKGCKKNQRKEKIPLMDVTFVKKCQFTSSYNKRQH